MSMPSSDDLIRLTNEVRTILISDHFWGGSFTNNCLPGVMAGLPLVLPQSPDAHVVVGHLQKKTLGESACTLATIEAIKKFAQGSGEKPKDFHAWIQLDNTSFWDPIGPATLDGVQERMSEASNLSALYYDETLEKQMQLVYTPVLTDTSEVDNFFHFLVKHHLAQFPGQATYAPQTMFHNSLIPASPSPQEVPLSLLQRLLALVGL